MKLCTRLLYFAIIVLLVFICVMEYYDSRWVGNRNYSYCEYYWSEFGFSNGVGETYIDVVDEIGKPEIYYYNEYAMYAKYKDFWIVYMCPLKNNVEKLKIDDYLFCCIVTYNPKYSFGDCDIGVSSTREDVIKAYEKVPFLNNAHSLTMFGYWDNNTAIAFAFEYAKIALISDEFDRNEYKNNYDDRVKCIKLWKADFFNNDTSFEYGLFGGGNEIIDNQLSHAEEYNEVKNP